MAVDSWSAETLEQLVGAVIAIHNEAQPVSSLWFRGVACAKHLLLPKIMRDGRSAEQVFDREGRLLVRFRQRGMAYWPAGYPQTDWEQLFAMQHYGMPTRLLDWTENLFVAAYFALRESPNHGHEGACVPVVWCLDPVGWNRAMPGLSEYGDSIHVLTTADGELDGYQTITERRRSKSPVAVYGSHNSERIVAQRGTFVVWGNECSPLEDFAPEASVAVLWRISLTGDPSSLFRDLRCLGFGETMVFPELAALAEELTTVEGWRP